MPTWSIAVRRCAGTMRWSPPVPSSIVASCRGPASDTSPCEPYDIQRKSGRPKPQVPKGMVKIVTTGSVIVAGARTPIGRLLGGLKGFSGAELGGVAIKSALERAGVAPEQVDYVVMGQVLQAGAGQIPARQAAVNAGIAMSVPAMTLNKVCLSGINAIAHADQLIRLGE